MKFKIERTFLVRTDEELDLDPNRFLHCATIEELNDEIEEYIDDFCEFPEHPKLDSCEQLGVRFWNPWYNDNSKSFYSEWQRLKGLPQEL